MMWLLGNARAPACGTGRLRPAHAGAPSREFPTRDGARGSGCEAQPDAREARALPQNGSCRKLRSPAFGRENDEK